MTLRQIRRTFVLLVLMATTLVPSWLFAQPLPRNLDSYVESVMKEFRVPGIGLAVVSDGKVLLAKGYGVRTLGESATVNEHTLFGIASNTKAFTATAIGILVEEGKLEWDAPIIRYLPWFRLSDPYVTHEMTIRDLLVHRSGLGLGAGDLLWWPASTYDRKEVTRRLQYIPLKTSFRSSYAYDNVLYLVAGEVIEAVSGQTWEDFVASHILAKVGMNDSNVRHAEARSGANVATTHAIVDGKLSTVQPFTSDLTNPAGGINASAVDMAKWLTVQLDSGRVENNSRLFSAKTTVQLWSIATPIPIGPVPKGLEILSPLKANFSGYGLGFFLRDYRGYKLVTHTGGLPGYVSLVMMIPQLKIGVAVLTNQESSEAFDAIGYTIVDALIGAPKTDWLKGFEQYREFADARVAAADKATATKRDSVSHPSLPLASYVGVYHDAWYGDVTITLEHGKLVMQFDHTPSLIGDLEHWQYDTFVARWRDRELRADAFVTFGLNPDASIDQVKMKAFSPSTDFSFDFQDLLLKPVKEAK